MAGSKVWESIDVLFFWLNEDFIMLYTVEIILNNIDIYSGYVSGFVSWLASMGKETLA